MRVLPINEEESSFIGYHKGSIVFCVCSTAKTRFAKIDAWITATRRSLLGWFAMAR